MPPPIPHDERAGMKIDYNLDPFDGTEADVRLSDAMLYAALVQVLGDRIEPFNTLHEHEGKRPLWGRKPFGQLPLAAVRAARTYTAPAVLEALGGGRILPMSDVQAEMDRLTAEGLGAVLRSMHDPDGAMRILPPGDRFEKHLSHLRLDSRPGDVLVHPNFDLVYSRRFLVVARTIAGETPVKYCEQEPLLLLDPESRNRMARDFMAALEPAEPAWLEAQRTAADALLDAHPLVSGAVDVGMRREPSGAWRAQVEAVVAGAPGEVDTFFADPLAYAERIADHLHVLVPEMTTSVPAADARP